MGGKEALPYDAKIEYLESTGTQYIEIPFGFGNTDEIYMTFSVDTTQISDKYMIAPKTWNNNSNRFGMGVHDSVFCVGYGAASTPQTKLTPNTRTDGLIHQWRYKQHIFDILDLNLTIDVSSITFGGTTTNLKLFFGYNLNTKGKIAYYKQVKNGVTVIELIPVRVGQVGYMYDKISGNLFGNDGTGDFVLGNDIT